MIVSKESYVNKGDKIFKTFTLGARPFQLKLHEFNKRWFRLGLFGKSVNKRSFFLLNIRMREKIAGKLLEKRSYLISVEDQIPTEYNVTLKSCDFKK